MVSEDADCGGVSFAVSTYDMRGRKVVCVFKSSYPYNARTGGHVGFSPTRQALLAPSVTRSDMFGESREG